MRIFLKRNKKNLNIFQKFLAFDSFQMVHFFEFVKIRSTNGCEVLGIFLDTETNGLNPLEHRTLEIAFKIVDLFSGDLLESYSKVIMQPQDIWLKSDIKSLYINGFTWDLIQTGISEEAAKKEIVSIFKKNQIKRGSSVFICQNPSFDRSFFTQLVEMETQDRYAWPYHWLDLASMFLSKTMHKVMERQIPFPFSISFSKDAIAREYHIPEEKKPHRAMNGVDHLLACYEKVVGFPAKKLSSSFSC